MLFLLLYTHINLQNTHTGGEGGDFVMPTGDAQLDSLLRLKAAVDSRGILTGELLNPEPCVCAHEHVCGLLHALLFASPCLFCCVLAGRGSFNFPVAVW